MKSCKYFKLECSGLIDSAVPVRRLSLICMESSLLGKLLDILIIIKHKQHQSYETNINTEIKTIIYQIHG